MIGQRLSGFEGLSRVLHIRLMEIIDEVQNGTLHTGTALALQSILCTVGSPMLGITLQERCSLHLRSRKAMAVMPYMWA